MIRIGDGKENPAEFEALRTDLHEHYQPVGPMQEMLVEIIADCHWRLRRAVRCEVGQIRLGLDTIRARTRIEAAEHVEAQSQTLLEEDENAEEDEEADEARRNLRKTTKGLAYLSRLLKDIRREVEQARRIGQDTLDEIFTHFGEELRHECLEVVEAHAPEGTEDEDFPERVLTPEGKKKVLATIDEMKDQLEREKKRRTRIEALELDAKIASLALPPTDGMEKILRYETTIERRLYRAVSLLESLQRKRGGDSPPAAVAV